MLNRRLVFATFVFAAGLSACGQPAPSAPAEPAAATAPVPAAGASVSANMAPLAYIIAQHSPLLDEATRSAISQDFNGAPLSGARAKHEVIADRVRCRSLNPPSGVPDCAATFAGADGAAQEVAITGEEATRLFEALAAAGVRDDAGMGHIVRELTGLQCRVDDALAQDTPATGDQVAGFSCSFAPV